MTNRVVAAGLSRFAHLAGLSRRPAKAEGDAPKDEDQDDEEKKKKEEEEEEAAKKAEEEEKKEKEEKAAAKKAEEDEEDEEDDEPDDEDGKKAHASGRRYERARCAAIFASQAAGGNPAMAAELAFNTSLSAAQAVGVLKTAPVQSGRTSLAARMAGTPDIRVGADKPSDPAATKASEASQQASRILAAARAAGGKF